MDLRTGIQVLNFIFALIAVIPSFSLLSVFLRDRKLLRDGKEKLNKILILLFGGVGLASLINAFIAFLALTNNGFVAHATSPYARTFVNMFFLFVSWSLYLFKKQTKSK